MIDWKTSEKPINYEIAVKTMETRVQDIISGKANELIWFLEHPSLYTAGTSAKKQDLLNPNLLPIYKTGRGGSYTYHGPGQRIVYLMLNLSNRKSGSDLDLHQYIEKLENWLIATLLNFGVKGEKRKNRVGIWVITPDGNEEKIAAIGIRVKRWVTFHGVSININPNLKNYDGIIACGVQNFGVTSLYELGVDVEMREVDQVLKNEFNSHFSFNL